jgi:DNA-binding MarR family transcriptional regulator
MLHTPRHEGGAYKTLNNLNNELLHALFKFKKAASQLPCDSNIRMSEVMALAIIDNHCPDKEKPLLASEIGYALSITPSAVSQIFTSLEKKGYVRRDISENDRRQYRFTLTEKGSAVTYKTKSQIDKTVNGIILYFGEDKIRAFTQMLNDFAGHLAELESGGHS